MFSFVWEIGDSMFKSTSSVDDVVQFERAPYRLIGRGYLAFFEQLEIPSCIGCYFNDFCCYFNDFWSMRSHYV